MIDEEWGKDPELNERFKELASLNLHDFKDQDEDGLLRSLGFYAVQRSLKKSGLKARDLSPYQLLLLVLIHSKYYDNCRAFFISNSSEDYHSIALWPHVRRSFAEIFLKCEGLLMIDFNKTIEQFVEQKLVRLVYAENFTKAELKHLGVAWPQGTLHEVLIELAGKYDG